MVSGIPKRWESCFRTVLLGGSLQRLSYCGNTVAVGTQKDIVLLSGVTGSQTAILSGHTDWINSLTFSLDGTLLVSGSSDKAVKLWDVQTGGVIRTFCDNATAVSSVAISADCAVIASAGFQDKAIHLWNVQTGEYCQVIKPQKVVDYVIFFHQNLQHISSISGNQVQVWDINGYWIGTSYDGSCIAFSLDQTLLALGKRGVILVQNTDTGAIVAELHATGGSPKYCCFSPDSKFIAAAIDGTAYVWDITSSSSYQIETFTGHANIITGLAFSSSSSLISVSKDRSVKFWQVTGLQAGPAEVTSESTLSSPVPIKSISIQQRSGVATSFDLGGVLKTWDLSTGHCVNSFQIPSKNPLWGDAQLIDGKLVAIWFKQGRIHIWDTEKNESLRTTLIPECRGIRISGDGSKVFCLGIKSVRALSIKTGELLGQVEWERVPYMDNFHSAGSTIWLNFQDSVVEGWDFGTSDPSPVYLSVGRPNLELLHTPFRIEEKITGRRVFQLSGRYGKPHAVQWSGQYLVAGYGSGEVLILDFYHLLSQ